MDYSFRKIAGAFDREMDRKFVTEGYKKGLWFHDTSSDITPAHRALTVAHTVADIDETLEKMDTIFKML